MKPTRNPNLTRDREYFHINTLMLKKRQDGMTYKEIAVRHKLPVASVFKRITLALEMRMGD